MRKSILLWCILFSNFFVLFLIFPKITHAQAAVTCTNFCCPKPGGYAGEETCYTGAAMTFSCSQDANMCASANGSPHPPNIDNPKAWTFYYNPTCTAVHWSSCDDSGTVVSTSCDWQHIDCSAVDRCDTGYASGSDYRVYAGQCNASSYNGSDPQTACTTGGWYKSCCTGQETSATSPLGHCNVIPYTRTCDRGSPTSASVITCPVTIPTCNDDIACTPDTCDGSAHPNTCYEGNGIKTNCEYTTFTSGSTVKSANCTRATASDQPCNVACPTGTQCSSDFKCIGKTCTLSPSSVTQTQTGLSFTPPDGCSETPQWTLSPNSGTVNGSGSSYTATGLTPQTSYTVTASLCNVSCSASFNTVTPTPSCTDVPVGDWYCDGTIKTKCIAEGHTTDYQQALKLKNPCTNAITYRTRCVHGACPINFGSWNGTCNPATTPTTFKINGTSGIKIHVRQGGNNGKLLVQGVPVTNGTASINLGTGNNSIPYNTPFTWFYEQANCTTPGEMPGSCYGGARTCSTKSSSSDVTVNPPSSLKVGTSLQFFYPDGSAYDGYGLSAPLPIRFTTMDTSAGVCEPSSSFSNFYLNGLYNNTGTVYETTGYWNSSPHRFSCGIQECRTQIYSDQNTHSFVANGFTGYDFTWGGILSSRCHGANCKGKTEYCPCIDDGEGTDTTYSRYLRYFDPVFPSGFKASLGPVTGSVSGTKEADGQCGISSTTLTSNVSTTFYGQWPVAPFTVRPPTTLNVMVLNTDTQGNTIASNINSTAAGEIKSNDNKIDCGTDHITCSAGYYRKSPYPERYSTDPDSTYNTQITLSPTNWQPVYNGLAYQFAGWGGCDTTDANGNCIVRMYNDKNVTIYFQQVPVTEPAASTFCPFIKVTNGDVYSGTKIDMTCRGGSVLPSANPDPSVFLPSPKSTETHTLADEFSGTNGAHNWYYYYITGGTIGQLIWGTNASSAWFKGDAYGNNWHAPGSNYGALIGTSVIGLDADSYLVYWQAPSGGGIATITVTDQKWAASAPDQPSIQNDGYIFGLGYVKNGFGAWPPQDWQQKKVQPTDTDQYSLTLTKAMTGGDAFVFNKGALAYGTADGDSLSVRVQFTPYP